MTALLEVRGATLAGRIAPTDLTVERGELVVVIGPNGGGKTSLLHAIAGIGKPGGDVFVNGEPLASIGPRDRPRHLGYVSASREILWPLKVADIVGSPGALDWLDLAHLATRRADRLSTGERARLLLARALAPRPALLLLDEPTANLDPLWQVRVHALLREEAERGVGVVATMHDLDAALALADRIVAVEAGRVTADAPPERIVAEGLLERVFAVRRSEGRWSEA